MESRQKSAAVTCSVVVVCCIFLLNITSCGGLRLHRDTESAMAELSNLFRSMFPLVPEQTHYFWKTNQLGSATVQRTSAFKKNDEETTMEGGTSESEVPWRLQIDFRKRGPDCMRKCINQGVLHPIQCHSLC